MEKERLEEIIEQAYESVMNQHLRSKDMPEVVKVVSEALRLIDAERGKSAVGYIDSSQLDRWNRLRGTEFEVAERCYMPWSATPFKSDISDCSTPVFLSPTIQEGMALVPIETSAESADLRDAYEQIEDFSSQNYKGI